ncbi:hypothetical protein, partial [Stutzerimonas stutzeri]|uniref:hypothetical protein n=1 Tax=Stutzerimonas stutzeri TaxID=316 RepID=UPI001BD405D3
MWIKNMCGTQFFITVDVVSIFIEFLAFISLPVWWRKMYCIRKIQDVLRSIKGYLYIFRGTKTGYLINFLKV